MRTKFLQNYDPGALERSRFLRRESTNSEKKLWMFLRKNQLGVHFRRQVPISKYIVDFAAIRCRLVVELDGSQHYTKEGRDRDRKRDKYLVENGFAVLRFSNVEVIKNIDDVLEKIGSYITLTPLLPSLQEEGKFAR